VDVATGSRILAFDALRSRFYAYSWFIGFVDYKARRDRFGILREAPAKTSKIEADGCSGLRKEIFHSDPSATVDKK
jgi:hypothetical protein